MPQSVLDLSGHHLQVNDAYCRLLDWSREELLAFFEGKVAKFWLPDDVSFIDALPMGATGKIQKNKLREQFRGYKLPTA